MIGVRHCQVRMRARCDNAVFTCLITVMAFAVEPVTAQRGVDLATVAISWALSAVTSVLLIFLAFVVRNRSSRHRPTKSPATAHDVERGLLASATADTLVQDNDDAGKSRASSQVPAPRRTSASSGHGASTRSSVMSQQPIRTRTSAAQTVSVQQHQHQPTRQPQTSESERRRVDRRDVPVQTSEPWTGGLQTATHSPPPALRHHQRNQPAARSSHEATSRRATSVRRSAAAQTHTLVEHTPAGSSDDPTPRRPTSVRTHTLVDNTRARPHVTPSPCEFQLDNGPQGTSTPSPTYDRREVLRTAAPPAVPSSAAPPPPPGSQPRPVFEPVMAAGPSSGSDQLLPVPVGLLLPVTHAPSLQSRKPDVISDVNDEVAEPVRPAPRTDRYRRRASGAWRGEAPEQPGESVEQRQVRQHEETSQPDDSVTSTSDDDDDQEGEEAESSGSDGSGEFLLQGQRHGAVDDKPNSDRHTPPVTTHHHTTCTAAQSNVPDTRRHPIRRRPASFNVVQRRDQETSSLLVVRRVSSSSDEQRSSRRQPGLSTTTVLRASHSEPLLPPDGRPQPATAAPTRRRVVRDHAANPSPPLRPRSSSSSPAERGPSPATTSITRGPVRPRQPPPPLALPPRRPAVTAASAPKSSAQTSTSGQILTSAVQRSSTAGRSVKTDKRQRGGATDGGGESRQLKPQLSTTSAEAMFSAPGPRQTSTPGPSTPNEKKLLKSEAADDACSVFTVELTSALTSRMTSHVAQRSTPEYIIPDACLTEISRSVGRDWRRLANELRICEVSEEKRHSTAELAALRAWRDRHLDRPYDAVDLLRRALATLRRTDLLTIVDFHAGDDARRNTGTDREGPKLVSTV